MRLAENLKVLRGNATISQEEMSVKLNISRQTISKWENGQSQPSIEMLVELANWFEVTIDDLIRGDVVKRSKPMFALDSSLVENTVSKDIAKDENDDNIGNIICPRIGLDGITSYRTFKKAYQKDVELEITGDKSLLTDIVHLYTEAFDQGVDEAAVNMLRILTNTVMNWKVTEGDKRFPLQERVDFYIDSLEESGHPAGAFYRAIHLIYRLVKNDLTEEENFDEGLILMYQLANEGNEFALNYVEYIESAEDDIE